MGGKKIKKVSLLFARDEFDAIINDLISLEIMDVSKPTLPVDDEEPSSQIKTEVINIAEYCANHNSLTLISTESTLYLTGWISAKSEVALITMASKYTCAWEIDTPTSEELNDAPIILARPKFLYRFYNGRRELFYPLCKEDEHEEVEESTGELEVDETTIEVEVEVDEIVDVEEAVETEEAEETVETDCSDENKSSN